MKLNSAACAVKEQTPGKYGKASSGGKSIKALLVLDPITLLNFIPDSNGSDPTVLLILSIFREGVTIRHRTTMIIKKLMLLKLTRLPSFLTNTSHHSRCSNIHRVYFLDKDYCSSSNWQPVRWRHENPCQQ